MKSLIQILFFLGCSLLVSCATNEKFANKAFHNLTARYNPYFLAKKRIDSVEAVIYSKRIDNYNNILEVIPFPKDTSELRQFDLVMNKNIKYAAIVPNRHENSKLLDPSYILVGKARFFLRDYENAINTLKYVNTKAKDENHKNQALIELLNIYTHLDDEKSAKTVINVLSQKQIIEKFEKRDFYLHRGDFFRRQNDYIETAKSLGSAVLAMKKGEKRARMYFILGQLYQKLERNNLSYRNYRSVLRNNPPYELDFYARLYATQVQENQDTSKTKKFFRKLLADFKNKEYQDKIYYEMGLFERKQGDIGEAISFMREALEVGASNPIQKAYTYWKLGEIQYADLQNYELAKAYYDSALVSLPKDIEEYPNIEKRAKVLDDFVKYLNTYRTQDSLQRMAKMDEPALGEYLTKMLTYQEIKKQREEDSIRIRNEKKERIRQKEEKNRGTLSEATGTQTGTVWYFYNQNQVQNGQNEFVKKWGTRPLEDNWRRANKPFVPQADSLVTAYQPIDVEAKRQQELEKRVEQRRKEIYNLLPKTPEMLKNSNYLIESSCYEIGKIYYLSLEEPQNALRYFEILLGRFPETNYEPEVLYLLYLIYQQQKDATKSEIYKQKLLSEFPNSSFAKLITNPDYLSEAKANEIKLKEGYKKAYELYELNKPEDAIATLQTLSQTYPQNLLADKFGLLQLMCEFKLDKDKPKFKKSLEAFVEKYPESDLLAYVKDLLDTVK